MKTYTENKNGSLVCDGMTIPKDESNRHYKKFLAEFEAGESELIAYVESEIPYEQLRAEELKAEALAYQSAQQSQNELGILHGYSVEELASKPIAKAQIDWMNSLFALQKAKELDVDNDNPFSSVGDKPHSFTEIYTEKFS